MASKTQLPNDPAEESQSQKNFLRKNLELIKQIQEKNVQKQTEQGLLKEKKQQEREQLKKEILEQTSKLRAETQKRQKTVDEQQEEVVSATTIPKKANIFRIKKQTSHQDFALDKARTISSTKDLTSEMNDENNSKKDVFKYDKEKMMKIYENKMVLPSVRGREALREKEKEGEIEEEQENMEKQKLRNYFRSRYASFINTLKYDLKLKKLNEENEKKRKESMLLKIREEMGLQNVTSKVMEPTNAFKAKQVAKNDNPLKRSLSETNENKEEKENIMKENQKKLLQKQKETLAKLFEKQNQKKQKEEEKTDKETKIKEKLKKHILKTLKSNNFKTLEPIIEKPPKKKESQFQINDSSNLDGLNLESGQLSKKHKKLKNTSLKPLRKNSSPPIDEDDDALKKISHMVTPNVTEGKKKKKKDKKALKFYPFISDLIEWKKKQRINPETKVFIILGGYGDLKHSLMERGWIENPDPTSLCFDVKWTLYAKDIIYDKLQDFQIVNHFEKNTSITTKVGLCKNLRNLIWFNNVDIDAFYPMCFDLGDPNDYEDFVQEFKCLKAESILKIYQKLLLAKNSKIKDYELKAKVALDVCERRVRDIDDYIDEKQPEKMITENEWEILASDEMDVVELAKKKHENWLKKIEAKYNTKTPSVPGEKKLKKKKKKKAKKSIEANEEGKEDDQKDGNEEDDFNQRVDDCIKSLQDKFPQFIMNGTKNIWIVKPAGLSRGRGIATYNNLVEILDHVESKESQWVVQKYIENPLLMKNRKFDIRQWVLVTDWNPLVIWVYEECYVRFSPEEYNVDDLSNKFIHLTNNSIAKYSSKFENSEIVGNMWTCDEFNNQLKEKEGYDVFYEKIKPKIKEIVKWSLESVQDMVENRKNSHELYGYDFMIDENYNTWLIEINSSPAMDYSTPVTERLVKMVLSDLPKVVVDYNLAKKKKKGIDTGLFTCIYKGATVPDKPLTSFGLNLCLEGKAIKK